MRGNPRRAKSVVQDGLDHGIVALDIVVYRERKVLYAHTVMTELHWMDASKGGELREGAVDAFHEMVKHPVSSWGVEILSFDEIELGQSGKTNVHVRAHLRAERRAFTSVQS